MMNTYKSKITDEMLDDIESGCVAGMQHAGPALAHEIRNLRAEVAELSETNTNNVAAWQLRCYELRTALYDLMQATHEPGTGGTICRVCHQVNKHKPGCAAEAAEALLEMERRLA